MRQAGTDSPSQAARLLPGPRSGGGGNAHAPRRARTPARAACNRRPPTGRPKPERRRGGPGWGYPPHWGTPTITAAGPGARAVPERPRPPSRDGVPRAASLNFPDFKLPWALGGNSDPYACAAARSQDQGPGATRQWAETPAAPTRPGGVGRGTVTSPPSSPGVPTRRPPKTRFTEGASCCGRASCREGESDSKFGIFRHPRPPAMCQ